MRTIELNPIEQRHLEEKCLADIHELNQKLKKWNSAYRNWEEFTEADKRYAEVYHGKEDFKTRVIDELYSRRRRLVKKLNEQIRQGFVLE